MLFARKDEKNQKLAAMSMKIFDVILLSQVWLPRWHLKFVRNAYRAILGQLENVVKNIYPEGGTFAGMLGHMPFLLKDN